VSAKYGTPRWSSAVPSYADATRLAGLDLSNAWEAPDWAKTAYGAAPADRVVDALRAVGVSETTQVAVVAAKKIGGWQAASDYVLSLLEAT
jgi:hypothetical protein